MAIKEPYRNPSKKSALAKSFGCLESWAETKAIIAEARGDKPDLSHWRNVAGSMAALSVITGAADPVAMIENTPHLRGPFELAISTLNGIAGLPPGHPDRMNPALRTAARRIAQFRTNVGEGLDCNNPFRVPECSLRR